MKKLTFCWRFYSKTTLNMSWQREYSVWLQSSKTHSRMSSFSMVSGKKWTFIVITFDKQLTVMRETLTALFYMQFLKSAGFLDTLLKHFYLTKHSWDSVLVWISKSLGWTILKRLKSYKYKLFVTLSYFFCIYFWSFFRSPFY